MKFHVCFVELWHLGPAVPDITSNLCAALCCGLSAPASAFPLNKNRTILRHYYGHGYYSERDSTWLFPEDKPCLRSCDPLFQTDASVPIIKSDLNLSPCLPGRHVEWISLCTAEASITVIPLQSAGTLRGRWKEQRREWPIHCVCHRRGHEQGSRRNQWPEPTTPQSYPGQKRTKD